MTQQRKGRRARLTALAAAISAASAPTVAADFQVTTTAPTGPGSLAQAITDANNYGNYNNEGSVPDTITITTSGTLSLAGYGLPSIDEAVTISGPGNFTINATEASEDAVFRFSTGESGGSSLSGLRITNAGYGALEVYSESIVTASDIVITDSGYAENPVSGALVQVRGGASLNMYDSTVTGNLTESGAINVSGFGSTLQLEGSTVSNNTKYGNGAALVVAEYGRADVYDSVLSGNTSYNSGGAVWATGRASVYIEASTLDKNTSYNNGGAVAASGYGTRVEISDSTLSGNTVESEGGFLIPRRPIGGGYGGAVSATFGSQLDIYRSTLSGNTASRGGAVGLKYTEFTTNIEDSQLKGNSAKYGGGIFVRSSDLRLDSSTLTGNTVAEEAGYSEFVRASGGAIHAESYSDLTIRASTLRNNSASGRGGAIFADRSYLEAGDSQIIANSAGTGGGLYLEDARRIDIDRSVVADNTASDSFGAMVASLKYGNGSLNIDESTISGNRSGDGAAVSLDVGGYNRGYVTNSTLSGNVGADAPAIDLQGYRGASLYLENSTFSDNRADGYPLAISAYVESLNIENVTFVDNRGQGTNTAQVHLPGTDEGLSTVNVTMQNSILSSDNAQEVVAGGYLYEDTLYSRAGVNVVLTANIMESGLTIAEGSEEDVSSTFGAVPTDPQLGPLADNGGQTKTHAPTSAAAPGINQGDGDRPGDEDQRGASTVGASDLGAVEYTDNTPPRLIDNLTGSLSGVVGKEISPIVVLDFFVDDEGDDITVENVIGLPAGLDYDEACEGAICGELSAAGEYFVSVTVSDDGEPSLSRTVSATVKVRDSAAAPVLFIDDDDDDTLGSVPLAGLSLLGALAWLRRRRY